jgi:hypothetical protein
VKNRVWGKNDTLDPPPTVLSVPRAAAEIFDRSRSRTAAAVVPQLAAEPQPQAFYEKFHFQNMSKKNHKVKKNWKK